MRQFQILFFVLIHAIMFGQNDFEIQTDSSTIRTKYFKNFNYIGEFNELKNNTKTYYRKYFYDSNELQEERIFGEDGNHIGISKEYSQEGKLISKIDHDNGVWLLVDKNEYPFYDLQNEMRIIADSLVSKMYGQSFLRNNTIWSIDGSAIYNETESGNWTDKFEKKPTKFLFRYDVKLDKENKYDDLIEFELDANGNFIPNQYETVFGFEDVSENLKGGFKLTFEDAIKQAKQLGLTENDTTKAVGILRWENFKKPELINGQFRFYVTILTKTIENIIPNGRSSRTTKYDIYSFNPWTGEFIEKKKMKSIYSWGQMSGSSTGLIIDNE